MSEPPHSDPEVLQIVLRLRREYTAAVAHLSDEELGELVEGDLEDAPALDITSADHKFRFAAIRFWPREVLAAPLSQAVILRVLNNFELSAAVRLDFIEKNVRDRPPRFGSGPGAA